MNIGFLLSDQAQSPPGCQSRRASGPSQKGRTGSHGRFCWCQSLDTPLNHGLDHLWMPCRYPKMVTYQGTLAFNKKKRAILLRRVSVCFIIEASWFVNSS